MAEPIFSQQPSDQDWIFEQPNAVDIAGLADALSWDFAGAVPAGLAISEAGLITYDGQQPLPMVVTVQLRAYESAGRTGLTTDSDPFAINLDCAYPAVIDYPGRGWATHPDGTLKVNGGIDGVQYATYQATVWPADVALDQQDGGFILPTADPAHAPYQIEWIYFDRIQVKQGIMFVGVPSLSPASLVHDVVTAATTVSEFPPVSPQDMAHATVIEQGALVQANTITPLDLVNELLMESGALVQAHTLAPADLVHLAAIESPGIAWADVLSPAGLVQATAINQGFLAQANIVTPQGLVHLVGMSASSFAQAAQISPQSLVHEQTMSSPGVFGYGLQPQDFSHLVVLETSFVTEALQPLSLLHSTSLTDSGIVVAAVVSPENIAHLLTLEGSSLVEQAVISPEDLDLLHVLSESLAVVPVIKLYKSQTYVVPKEKRFLLVSH